MRWRRVLALDLLGAERFWVFLSRRLYSHLLDLRKTSQ
jgi:hypothetical protein